MSWNGTVRCSYCYEKGHNKRSCKKLIEYYEENPDCYSAKRYKEKKAKGKIRRCTYCNLKGHNRATCGHLKIAKEAYVKDVKKWRKAWIDWMVAEGYGIGSLLHCAPDYRHKRGLYVIREFNWSVLNHHDQDGYYQGNALRLLCVKNMRDAIWGNLPRHDELVKKGSPDIKMVGPVPITKKEILAMAPGWWKKGYHSSDEKLNDVFDKDRHHEEYHENGYKD